MCFSIFSFEASEKTFYYKTIFGDNLHASFVFLLTFKKPQILFFAYIKLWQLLLLEAKKVVDWFGYSIIQVVYICFENKCFLKGPVSLQHFLFILLFKSRQCNYGLVTLLPLVLKTLKWYVSACYMFCI